MSPLKGIKVVDFTTLIPGPFASLILSQAGAEVIKIERRGSGDDLRSYGPFVDNQSVLFALLNAGKESRFFDLKQEPDRSAVLALLDGADVLIEQFRPGVMARLGLDYQSLRRLNPRLIYCSITAYGQDGPRAGKAAHDINMLASTGMLSQVADGDGTPSLLPLPLADLAGGAYPALFNILLALRERDRTGLGCHLDIAMADNLFGLMMRPFAAALVGEMLPPNQDLITGASPRYACYRTRDGRYLAVGALEDKFWTPFCALLGVAESADKAAIVEAVALRDSAEWSTLLTERDVCCSLVQTVDEAIADPAFAERGLFLRQTKIGERGMAALPDPIAPRFRGAGKSPKMPPDRNG
jgi:crotonobetainyl-CoA:carnitine CoA-transferase CaiB-like acyl-CoA transferase